MIAFLAVTLWAVIAWALETLNDVAVGIILPVLYVLFCGVTKKVVFAPWLSEVPIIVIGGFTLGKIIQVTGLGKRIALTCVKLTGGSFSGALAGITLGAVIVAPLVPSIMPLMLQEGRSTAITPTSTRSAHISPRPIRA